MSKVEVHYKGTDAFGGGPCSRCGHHEELHSGIFMACPRNKRPQGVFVKIACACGGPVNFDRCTLVGACSACGAAATLQYLQNVLADTFEGVE